MKKTINISSADFISALHLLEKIHYITHRANNREDSDNRAYALALTFARQNVEQELNNQRMKLWSYLSDEERDEIEPLFEDIEYNLPFDKDIEELRAELNPYLCQSFERFKK